MSPLEKELRVVEATLNVLADCVLQEQPPVRRRKLEHLVRTKFEYTKTRMKDQVDDENSV